MKKMNAGVWTGITIFVFSSIFFYQSLDLAYSSSIGPGPGFFPIWLTGILLVLSVLYILISFKETQKVDYEFPKEKSLKISYLF